jgi:acyl-CoA reductase-like NAD-dependent aldehyde dehydrogenase
MSQSFNCISPIDNRIYLSRDYASSEQIQSAFNQAINAQHGWQQTSISERASLCHRMVDSFVSMKETIAEEICWQMGRPIRYAAGEVDGFEERARYMIDIAESALATVEIPEKPGFKRYIKHQALGTVFIISPWNYPYLTAVNAIVPAMMAGNTVVLKASAQVPLCAERLAEAFNKAGLPEGVFQYLHMTHSDTQDVIKNAPINQVCFTGSVEGGQQVEESAAGRFLGVGLELGGKDPAYVRADADLNHAVETIIDGAMFNAGQSCCGIERAYIHESVYDPFIEKAVALVNQYILGRSDDPKTTLGPMVRASAADRVRQQINEAVASGAKTLIDPKSFPMDQPGTPYLAPQLLVDVTAEMSVMREESFGPVLGIQKVSSDEEAIRLMNDSDFGLTASVFTQDLSAGEALGEQIQTGTFFINRCDYLDPALAWTGIKQSGRGCTLSRLGYEHMTRPKSFHLKSLG